jgi:O-antigen/teichoic acid export membrane protein
VVGGVTPGLGGVIGSGNLQKAVRVRSEIMSLAWLVATVVGTTILLWNRAFVRLWVGGEYYVGPIPNLLIMLMVMQFVLIRNDAFIIDLTLNLRRKVLMGALSATVSLVLAGILVRFFNLGITGLCLGFIAGRSLLSLAYPWLVGRFLGVSLYSQLKSVLRPAFITVLIFMLMLSADDFLTASTWVGLIVSVGLTLVVVSLLAFYTGLSDDQRRRILQRVRLVTRPATSD